MPHAIFTIENKLYRVVPKFGISRYHHEQKLRTPVGGS